MSRKTAGNVHKTLQDDNWRRWNARHICRIFMSRISSRPRVNYTHVVLTYAAEEWVVTVHILALFVSRVSTTWISVVGVNVLRRRGQQAILLLSARSQQSSNQKQTTTTCDNAEFGVRLRKTQLFWDCRERPYNTTWRSNHSKITTALSVVWHSRKAWWTNRQTDRRNYDSIYSRGICCCRVVRSVRPSQASATKMTKHRITQ